MSLHDRGPCAPLATSRCGLIFFCKKIDASRRPLQLDDLRKGPRQRARSYLILLNLREHTPGLLALNQATGT
ncbi:hypothetical protein GGD63_000127 [Bradyrhizobium sp. cir1]|uniref:hypothetical protein n=1 Tax=Bradyrhizobium sp. cir1 TaxID=1445730 RepID=UPI0016066177|nr:hypothetical protein [Bradyrhizobium sp. cir1]MBB4367358.1 hypothetical protein [Bradyrhizobium sp. cir1]